MSGPVFRGLHRLGGVEGDTGLPAFRGAQVACWLGRAARTGTCTQLARRRLVMNGQTCPCPCPTVRHETSSFFSVGGALARLARAADGCLSGVVLPLSIRPWVYIQECRRLHRRPHSGARARACLRMRHKSCWITEERSRWVGLLPAQGFSNRRRSRRHSGFLSAIVCDARTLQGSRALRPNRRVVPTIDDLCRMLRREWAGPSRKEATVGRESSTRRSGLRRD